MRYDGVPLKEAQANLVAQGAHPAIQTVLQGMYGFVQFKPKSRVVPRLLNELEKKFCRTALSYTGNSII